MPVIYTLVVRGKVTPVPLYAAHSSTQVLQLNNISHHLKNALFFPFGFLKNLEFGGSDGIYHGGTQTLSCVFLGSHRNQQGEPWYPSKNPTTLCNV